MSSKISRELALIVTGKDAGATKTLRNVNREVNSLQKTAGRAGTNVARNIERGLAVGAIGAAGAIGYAVKAAMDWESAVAGVNKTIDATPAELKAITDGLIAMSNRMPTSANDLAGIAEQAGALGIAKADILSFTETVAILGATTNVTTDDAATALGQLSNVIGLTGADYDNFASALVDLGNKGASTEADILEITRRAGAAAKQIGVAKEETLGWASAAANLGLNPELAGTAVQNFFLKAQGLVAEGTPALAEIAGESVAGFKKLFRKDASGALEQFLNGLGKLPKDKRLKAVQQLFGKGSGLTRLVLGLSDSIDRNLTPSLDTSVKAWQHNTAAAAEFQKRSETTAVQMDILRNNVHNAASVIGTELLPTINDLAKEGVAWITDHQDEIHQFAEDLAAGFRDAVTWAKGLDWPMIQQTMGGVASAVSTIVDGFAGMPDWVKQAVLTGWGLNKLTGGAVTDLGKVAFDMFAGRGSSPANPLWVSQVGGGGTPGGPGGPPGSGSGNKPNSGITVPAMGAAVGFEMQPVFDKAHQAYADLQAAHQRELAWRNTPVTPNMREDRRSTGVAQNSPNPDRTEERMAREATATAKEIARLTDVAKGGGDRGRKAEIRLERIRASQDAVGQKVDTTNERIEQNRVEMGTNFGRQYTAIGGVTTAATSGLSNTAAASREAGRMVAGAVRGIGPLQMSVAVTVPINNQVTVSGRDVFSEVVTTGIRTHQTQHSGMANGNQGPA